MRYNEFAEKLKSMKAEYLKARGREPETVRELEEFLEGKLLKPRSRSLRSLRGLGF